MAKPITEEDLALLTVVPNEAEAATLVGYLDSEGIEASYREGGNLPEAIIGTTVPHEVFVHTRDLDAARAVLPA
jgi:hypothetical protein